MTTSYYIDKAIHAINTDQPNLAMLYLRRGIVESRKNYPNAWLDARDGIQAIADAFNSLVDLFAEVGQAFTKFYRDIQGYYDQEFYALVNDQ